MLSRPDRNGDREHDHRDHREASNVGRAPRQRGSGPPLERWLIGPHDDQGEQRGRERRSPHPPGDGRAPDFEIDHHQRHDARGEPDQPWRPAIPPPGGKLLHRRPRQHRRPDRDHPDDPAWAVLMDRLELGNQVQQAMDRRVAQRQRSGHDHHRREERYPVSLPGEHDRQHAEHDHRAAPGDRPVRDVVDEDLAQQGEQAVPFFLVVSADHERVVAAGNARLGIDREAGQDSRRSERAGRPPVAPVRSSGHRPGAGGSALRHKVGR